jgi:hypothetical protein
LVVRRNANTTTVTPDRVFELNFQSAFHVLHSLIPTLFMIRIGAGGVGS